MWFTGKSVKKGVHRGAIHSEELELLLLPLLLLGHLPTAAGTCLCSGAPHTSCLFTYFHHITWRSLRANCSARAGLRTTPALARPCADWSRHRLPSLTRQSALALEMRPIGLWNGNTESGAPPSVLMCKWSWRLCVRARACARVLTHYWI